MSALETLRIALFGNPASSATKPSREGVLAAFADVVRALNAFAGGAIGSTVTAVYASRSTLNGHLEFPDRTLGLVYNDGPNNTGIYIKSGPAGSGSWVFTGLFGTGPEGPIGPMGPGPSVEVIQAAIASATSTATNAAQLADLRAAAAAQFASQAEALAIVLQVTTAGGWFTSETDAELLALPNGTGAFIITPEGDFYTVEMVNGAPVRRATFLTRFYNRHNGINLWEFAKGDGIADDTAGVQAAVMLASVTGARINCGGPDLTYLIAGAHATFGDWNGVGGPFPFKRGVIRMRSNVRIVGQGAKFLLSGGRTDPGGLFYHAFWEEPYLDNWSFEGVELDGNLPNQIITPIPANTHDDKVWQHGHGIAVYGSRNAYIKNCRIHGFRGAGANIGSSVSDNGAPGHARSRNFRVSESTFYDNFSHDIGGGIDDFEVVDCRFIDGTMPSRWVGALDIEKLDAWVNINNVHIHRNVFDFRFGYRPTESTPQFASNSSQALAMRRRLRRACTGSFYYTGFPGNVYNGTMDGFSFTDNTVYQGTVDVNNWINVDISRNKFFNTYEDMAGVFLAPGNCIGVTQFANDSTNPARVTGLYGATIRDNKIDHDISGAGIFVEAFENISVGGGYIKRAREAGVRLNGCSGSVSDIDIENVGANDNDQIPALQGMFSSAVVAFGGMARSLRIADIRAVETRSGSARRMTRAVYANVGAEPLTRIENVTGTGMLVEIVKDVNGSTLQQGNVNASAPVLAFSRPVEFSGGAKVTNGSLEVSSTTGDVAITLAAAPGKESKVVFTTAGGLEFIQSLLGSGRFSLNSYNNGTPVAVPFAIENDGRVVMDSPWHRPLQLYGTFGSGDTIRYLWISTPGVLRISETKPTADGDGVAVGSQA